ncbi:MAG TPA: hypothetical protein VE224_16745, partial [Pseudolabrys sp.]|nr:hypothetical protein [Pseudolabrys sp.]
MAKTQSFAGRVDRFRTVNAWWIKIACHAASIVLLVALWQAFGNRFGVLFVPFTKTMTQLWAMVTGGQLLPALWVSGKLYLVSLALDIVLGVVIGLL